MKYCGDCFHITFNEEDQNYLKAFENKDVEHRCKKYKVRLMHRNRHPLIVPCPQCEKEDGFESFNDVMEREEKQ